jgi:6 kDa early secretory antigenic target
MAVFSVDSDAVLTTTAAMRGSIERLEGESAGLLAQLSQLQGSWTGAAAASFHGSAENWRAMHAQLTAALAEISAALAVAGQQYADVEQHSIGLFR